MKSSALLPSNLPRVIDRSNLSPRREILPSNLPRVIDRSNLSPSRESTDQIYHRAAKRRGDKFDRSMTRGKLLGNNALLSSRLGDKFDRSMTRGKLLGNNALLFIFISILIMTQLISFL